MDLGNVAIIDEAGAVYNHKPASQKRDKGSTPTPGTHAAGVAKARIHETSALLKKPLVVAAREKVIMEPCATPKPQLQLKALISQAWRQPSWIT